MSHETARPGRIRPLPPTPVAHVPEASPSSFYRPQSPRDSLITVGSTILPEYSSVVGNETEVARDEDDGSPTGASQPPRYSYVLSPTSSIPQASVDRGEETGGSSGPLNSGRQRPSFVERRLHLKNSDKPWATLKLISRGPLPNSKSKALRFIGGDSVRGVLELKLDSPTSIENMSLNLEGRVTAAHEESSFAQDTEDSCTIMDYRHVLYSKRIHLNPRFFGKCMTSKKGRPDGKLHGTYHIPFAFSFPTAAAIGVGRKGTSTPTYDLPPSFFEDRSEIRTKYDLILSVDHGFLKKESKARTDIVYMPKIVAPPVSKARSKAYESGTLFPGPRDDPNGWHGTPSAHFSVKFFDREAHISCNLWLAKPLCYTRGTVIPCYLALSGFNPILLEHLASPQMVQVRLTRCIYFGGSVQSPSNKPREDNKQIETCSVGEAVWWRLPNSDHPEDRNNRWLEGEIPLPQSLHASCDHPCFSIEYYVDVMPFLSDELISQETGHPDPTVRQRVEIATFHQYGPVPRPLTARKNEIYSPIRSQMKGKKPELAGPKFPSSVFQLATYPSPFQTVLVNPQGT